MAARPDLSNINLESIKAAVENLRGLDADPDETAKLATKADKAIASVITAQTSGTANKHMDTLVEAFLTKQAELVMTPQIEHAVDEIGEPLKDVLSMSLTQDDDSTRDYTKDLRQKAMKAAVVIIRLSVVYEATALDNEKANDVLDIFRTRLLSGDAKCVKSLEAAKKVVDTVPKAFADVKLWKEIATVNDKFAERIRDACVKAGQSTDTALDATLEYKRAGDDATIADDITKRFNDERDELREYANAYELNCGEELDATVLRHRHLQQGTVTLNGAAWADGKHFEEFEELTSLYNITLKQHAPGYFDTAIDAIKTVPFCFFGFCLLKNRIVEHKERKQSNHTKKNACLVNHCPVGFCSSAFLEPLIRIECVGLPTAQDVHENNRYFDTASGRPFS